MTFTKSHILTLVAIATAGFALAGARVPSAQAATTCSLANGLLEVRMSQDGDRAGLVPGGAAIVVLGNAGSVACAGGTPTTTNIDTVLVVDDSDNPATPAAKDGDTTLALYRPASFGPGKTPEAGGGEIEFVANMNAGNYDTLLASSALQESKWTAGSNGYDWNGDLARELIGGPFDDVTLNGGDISDRISAQGGGNTGGPLTIPRLTITGGQGGDTLLGSNYPYGDDIEGGPGDDIVEGFGGGDALHGHGGNDTVTGGPGIDSAVFDGDELTAGVNVDLGRTDRQDTGEGLDSLTGVESLEGSEFADTLIGNDASNELIGAGGDDRLDGRGGSDALEGQAGTDTITFAQAPVFVVVDLAARTAVQGADADAVDTVENIVGSRFADTLAGDAFANLIEGGPGTDTVAAGAGADRVVLRDGESDKASCGADTDTAVTDSRTLDAIAVDCETVDALPEPQPTPPATPGQQPTTTPDSSLSFALAGASSQRMLAQKAVHVRVRSPLEAATVVASASGRLSGRRQASTPKLRLKRVSIAVGAGQTKTLKLRLSKASLVALHKALVAKRRPTVTVTAHARDAAGNRVVRTLRVKAKR